MPPQYSVATITAPNTIAVPRSGCCTTIPMGTATAAIGAHRRHSVSGVSRHPAMIFATNRIVATLAIWAGWNASGPRSIQLLVPAAVPRPVPMTSVAASSARLTM